jgi:hypothetical protein
MALLYLGVMILLEIAGYDVIRGDSIELQAFLGIVFATVCGIMKIWRVLR